MLFWAKISLSVLTVGLAVDCVGFTGPTVTNKTISQRKAKYLKVSDPY